MIYRKRSLSIRWPIPWGFACFVRFVGFFCCCCPTPVWFCCSSGEGNDLSSPESMYISDCSHKKEANALLRFLFCSFIVCVCMRVCFLLLLLLVVVGQRRATKFEEGYHPFRRSNASFAYRCVLRGEGGGIGRLGSVCVCVSALFFCTEFVDGEPLVINIARRAHRES